MVILPTNTARSKLGRIKLAVYEKVKKPPLISFGMVAALAK